MSDSIPCAITLYPSQQLADLAYQTHKELKQKGTLATSSDSTYDAHLSLYLLQIDRSSINKVRELLEGVAHSLSPFSLKAKEIRQGGGWVDVVYERNDAIRKIQLQVIEMVNPLRDGLRDKDKQTIGLASGVVLDNLEKYGYRNVGNEFVPHLTFARFVDTLMEVEIDTDIDEFDSDFISIGMFEVGDYGVCLNKLFEIQLSN